MSGATNTARSGVRRATLAAVALAAVVLVLAGCSFAGTQGSATTRTMPRPTAQSTASGSTGATSDVQTCAQCDGGKGAPPVVVGQAITQGGAQVVNVGFVNGYYSPNAFTVKAGTPVQVVFAGKAAGCLAHPQFASLGKKADVTATGSGTIELGTLKPGVYKFTCAMGMNAGTITVR
jgi:plastocyanin